MKKKLHPAFSPGYAKLLFFFLFFSFASGKIFAQAVSGRVTDPQGRVLGNVSVKIKGSEAGTSTDVRGQYTINASPNATLVFSSVGYAVIEVPISNRTTVDAVLTLTDKQMETVIVTALGIKRQERKLGYAATSVKTDDLVTNRTNNVGESLEGRVAGLNISAPSAGAGASTQIRLRGQVGFAGSTNSPLIVINGLPLDQGVRNAEGGGNLRDQGDNLQVVNPDDIESMTVLKGSTASALYGSRAAAGAIIITTKSGAKNAGMGIEYTSSITTQTALNYMDQFQTVYGQGTGGLRPASGAAAAGNAQFGWGARLDGVPTPIFDGSLQPYSAYEDRLFDYLQNGMNFTNTLALSGGGANGSYRASFSKSDAKGIEPRDEYKKKIFNIGLTQNVTKKLKLLVNINWANEIQSNPPQVGVQGAGSVNFFTRLAISTPSSAYKNSAVNPTTGTEAQTSGFQGTVLNPYYANQAGQNWETKRDRILGTATLRYDIKDWLYIQGRYNYNYTIAKNENHTPYGIGTSIPTNADGTYKGNYSVSQGKGTEINADFLVGGDHQFGKFSVEASFGGNTYRSEGDNLLQTTTNFLVKDLYSIANGNVKTQSYTYGRSRVNSLYGLAEFGYNRLIYVNFTGREDWFSVYNPKNNHVFYPSVSTSFVFSELMKKQTWLNFGKLRLAFSRTGSANGVSPYEGILNYAISPNNFNNQPTATVDGSIAPNALLVPYSVKEQELGLEMRMFQNKLLVDISAFKKVTTDQVLPVTLSNASGYLTSKDNLASLRNSGIETLIEYTPIKHRNLTWTSSWNNAYLDTKVLSIAPGVKDFLLIYFNGTGNEFLGQVHYTEGMAINQLYTRTYKRDAAGNILVKNGRLQATTNYVPMGSSIPKFTGGWSNSFTHRNLNLTIFVDYKFGGKIMSATALNMLRQGLSKASLAGRRDGENGIVFPGIDEATGQPNTVAVTDLQGFYADYRNLQIGDPFVFKSDFIKLRNVSLSYNLTSLVNKVSYLRFFKGLTLSASVRNLAILYKDLPGLDPEALPSSGDTRAGYENAALPTTRSYNLSLNVKF
ncbi:SusC/RagA family TonB-linked outer membrane protein [Ferruginibacter sp. HRS2-29]|uniref:SusC/RagA family TonB-linked outer membrane protein n=1 Tax=Ferruginibacter sp. HRS2-29 TaxID=2487334 RepID=UPI0020CE4596|nr:SusC/RagA family TonB-linked outer membrane protein [Ferruginibacter sp. HRS2-29]MCP9753447.1 SusC/RagA family TonB-linked outer membrane protein [Ferruginibacter sp. HRS2-29]